MIATDIRIDERDGQPRLSGLVHFDSPDRPPFRLEWRLPGGDASWLTASGESFVAALLLPAMYLGEDLTIDAPVSPRLVESIETIVDIYSAWVPGVRRISLKCQSVMASEFPKATGLFFSCGVDSFYSLQKALQVRADDIDRVSHLILAYGFDIRPRNRPLFEIVAKHANEVAAAVGRDLVLVETNLRDFSDALIGWDFYHGAALAGIGLALGGLQRKCLIPSTHAYGELVPWGSHPLLDPLWSTESLDFVHDGCEALRTEKVRKLTEFPLALQHLRVCWPDWIEDYNCGRCEKCLRTMIALHAAGALNRSATFPHQLDIGAIRDLELITGESSVRFMEDLLAALGPAAEDQAVAQAIRNMLRKKRWRARLGLILDRTPYARRSLAAFRGTISSVAPRRPLVAGSTSPRKNG